MSHKVSIIMPAYKAQATIKKSINSILTQDYPDIELLVVVDGLSDETYSVVESMQDSHIKAFKKENGGVVGAYKYGISQASGDYIMFCDSDDTYKPGYISRAVELMEKHNCDFVSFAYDVVDSHDQLVEEIHNTLPTGFYDQKKIQEEIIPHLVFNSFDRTQMFILLVLRWNKIYSRSLIEKFYSNLDENCYQIEDNVFTVNAVLNANSFYIDNDFKCYNYFISDNSISSGYQGNDILDRYFYSVEKIAQLTKGNPKISPSQVDFLAYDNARIVFRRCCKNADFNTACQLLNKIKKNERVQRVHFGQLSMLKNKIYHIGLKLHLYHLLYVIFKR